MWVEGRGGKGQMETKYECGSTHLLNNIPACSRSWSGQTWMALIIVCMAIREDHSGFETGGALGAPLAEASVNGMGQWEKEGTLPFWK